MRKKRRILVLMHEELVPPDSLRGETRKDIDEYRTELDVALGLEAAGHEVLKLGVGSDLGPIRQAFTELEPDIAFNLLVVGASLGLLTLLQPAMSPDPLNSVTPILLFAVMFGLSMDYMVIILSRMRELYRDGMPYEQAVLEGAARTRSMVRT